MSEFSMCFSEEELKEKMCDLINNMGFTKRELELLFDIIFYTYTEDFYFVCHAIRKLNNFRFGSLPCIKKLK